MNLTNLLSSSEGSPVVSNQPVHTSMASGYPLTTHATIASISQQQYPNLPGVPGIVPQQILGSISPALHQIKSGASSSGMMISGMNRQAKLEGPVSKKPKM